MVNIFMNLILYEHGTIGCFEESIDRLRNIFFPHATKFTQVTDYLFVHLLKRLLEANNLTSFQDRHRSTGVSF